MATANQMEYLEPRDHAKTIAFGVFVAAAGIAIVQAPDIPLWANILGWAFLAAGCAYSITYVISNVAPWFLGETIYPEQETIMDGPDTTLVPDRHGNLIPTISVNRALERALEQEDAPPGYIRLRPGGTLARLTGGLTVDHIEKLASAIHKNGLDVISKRALDANGVISRYATDDPNGDLMIQWLRRYDLLQVKGNSQYGITESLKQTTLPYLGRSEVGGGGTGVTTMATAGGERVDEQRI